jgi:ribosomal protein S6--L-glutamate ligase
MVPEKRRIALGTRLRRCHNVITLGVKPNFDDYSPDEQEWITGADRIYYPTAFYADLFNTMGKPTFPSYHNYKLIQDKIRQTAMFTMQKLPHPRTRVFYGKRSHRQIPDYFRYPFVGKIPRGSSQGRGVYLISSHRDLESYCRQTHAAYIQEFLPARRNIRVVVIGRCAVHAYWREAQAGEFRTNLSVGGRIFLDPVPEEATALALLTAERCGFDDVGIDIHEHEGRFLVIEANMKYGREGFRRAGIDYHRLMEGLIDRGEI